MNVLIVDDQISVLDGIAAGVHFQELGIQNIRYATTSERAMAILADIPIDVMFTDIEMPGEDGLALNQRVRESYPDVVRILLTSHAKFEYAKESIRLGCFDYLLQPASYEEIEAVLRKALQYIYERKKKNQIYELGKKMQTSEMELLDRVALNLFSSRQADVESSMELLSLMGYPVRPDKKALLMILRFEEFRKTDTPIVSEKELHKAIFQALKQAGITYPILPITTIDHRRQVILLLVSALQEEMELGVERHHLFFKHLCAAMPADVIDCHIGGAGPIGNLRQELIRIQATIDDRSAYTGVLHLEQDSRRAQEEASDFISGSGSRWRALLAAGQKRVLMKEFDACLDNIIAYSSNKSKALCDLHQRVTYMFFNYFYDNNADIHSLFRDQYSYTDYMGSFTDPDSLRHAVQYMMKQVDALEAAQAPINDVEKAKTFIAESISDPITVKEVADHVCLSAEYFTKLFKKETGQNIKEYITLTKIEAAKDMLEHSTMSVGMVALELGYTNFSHFSQVFKKYEDMTPSEYRAKFHLKAVIY